MRISVIQMNQGSNKAANLDQARSLVAAACESDRPALVSLPESRTRYQSSERRSPSSSPTCGARRRGRARL